MRLFKCCGLISESPDLPEFPEDEEGEGIEECLLAESEAFLRGGGVISLREWEDLSSTERAALAVAGDRLRREMAALIGVASQDSLSAADVYAPVDGGVTQNNIALATAVAKAATDRRGTTIS